VFCGICVLWVLFSETCGFCVLWVPCSGFCVLWALGPGFWGTAARIYTPLWHGRQEQRNWACRSMRTPLSARQCTRLCVLTRSSGDPAPRPRLHQPRLTPKANQPRLTPKARPMNNEWKTQPISSMYAITCGWSEGGQQASVQRSGHALRLWGFGGCSLLQTDQGTCCWLAARPILPARERAILAGKEATVCLPTQAGCTALCVCLPGNAGWGCWRACAVS